MGSGSRRFLIEGVKKKKSIQVSSNTTHQATSEDTATLAGNYSVR